MRFCTFRRFLLFLALAFAPTFCAFAENLEIVMPKLIYIGDTIEIRYIFHSDANLFMGDLANQPSAKQNLDVDYPVFSAHEADFSVRTASLEKINAEYTLSLSVIPWKTGNLVIPPFDVASLVAFSQKSSGTRASFIVKLSPIEVRSLAAHTGTREFLPPSPPLVLPGTTALLAALAIFALILLAALIFVLLHLPRVTRFVTNLAYLYSLRKNSRKTIKKLLALQKNSASVESDKDFAAALQHILREFLKHRFSHDFDSVTTARLYAEFSDLCGGELNEHQTVVVENLVSLFSRLDFVRFADGARFLPEHENGGTSERISITENAIQIIEDFDAEGESR